MAGNSQLPILLIGHSAAFLLHRQSRLPGQLEDCIGRMAEQVVLEAEHA